MILWQSTIQILLRLWYIISSSRMLIKPKGFVLYAPTWSSYRIWFYILRYNDTRLYVQIHIHYFLLIKWMFFGTIVFSSWIFLIQHLVVALGVDCDVTTVRQTSVPKFMLQLVQYKLLSRNVTQTLGQVRQIVLDEVHFLCTTFQMFV